MFKHTEMNNIDEMIFQEINKLRIDLLILNDDKIELTKYLLDYPKITKLLNTQFITDFYQCINNKDQSIDEFISQYEYYHIQSERIKLLSEIIQNFNGVLSNDDKHTLIVELFLVDRSLTPAKISKMSHLDIVTEFKNKGIIPTEPVILNSLIEKSVLLKIIDTLDNTMHKLQEMRINEYLESVHQQLLLNLANDSKESYLNGTLKTKNN